MCTGMVSIATVLRSTSLGAEGCIFKPIVDASLVTEAVDRALEKIDGWWNALRDWNQRMKSCQSKQSVLVESHSYGFHTLSPMASGIEESMRSGSSLEQIMDRLNDFIDSCERLTAEPE